MSIVVYALLSFNKCNRFFDNKGTSEDTNIRLKLTNRN